LVCWSAGVSINGLRRIDNVQAEYNILNLPKKIFGTTGDIKYIYTANGEKLASVVGSSLTYYRGVMVY
jgi:hypothetical protein